MRVCPTCRHQFPAGSNFCPHDGHKLEDLAHAPSTVDPFIGVVLDNRYKVESLLGSGGMGNVYAARHVVIDKPVAIKILRLEYSKDPRQAERFIREARAASRIGHPNIVDVTDFGRLDNGQIFFVMEYLQGVTLAREMRTQGALSTRRVLNLGIQICHALGAAHAKGIVHRDLKPENIFIVNPITAEPEEEVSGRQQDSIKLLDFGIAKITWDEQQRRLTKVGSIFGTPQYMSPEQAAGKETDLRGDVYSLGCIIYEMLTGELPFIADTFMGTLTKQMFENPVPPRQLRPDLGILAPLELLVLRAMEKDPDKRFRKIQELADALDQCYALSEIGPTRRSPRVVLPPEAPAVAAITDAKLETVHLLVKTSTQSASEVSPDEDESSNDAATRAPAPLSQTQRGRQLTWLWAGLVFVLLSGGGIFIVLRSATPKPEESGVVIASADAGDDRPDSAVGRAGRSKTDARAATTTAQRRRDAQTAGAHGTQRREDGVVSVRFLTVPAGAQVIKDGRTLGRCPYTIRLSAGRGGRFVFRLAGYRDGVLKIAPRRSEDHVIHLQRRGQIEQPHKVITTPFGSSRDLRSPFEKNRSTPKPNP